MINNELNRLNFEDIIWLIFAILSIFNIISNQDQKQYIITNNQKYEDSANSRTIFVLTILIIISGVGIGFYINKENKTKADSIKVLGSLLFVTGTICLLYFQIHSKDNFIGGAEL